MLVAETTNTKTYEQKVDEIEKIGRMQDSILDMLGLYRVKQLDKMERIEVNATELIEVIELFKVNRLHHSITGNIESNTCKIAYVSTMNRLHLMDGNAIELLDVARIELSKVVRVSVFINKELWTDMQIYNKDKSVISMVIERE